MSVHETDPPDSSRRDWRDITAAWQQLSPEEQLRRRLERIPEKVARSMAFEGEPVDIEMLKRYLDEYMSKEQTSPIEKEQEK